MGLGPEVMLASPGKRPASVEIESMMKTRLWWFEVKFDGIRAVITRTAAGVVTITNRRRTDITYRYPDVAVHWQSVPFVGVVDGEIIVLDKAGRPDFAAVHRRDAQGTAAGSRRSVAAAPATFVPFDVLEHEGADQRERPYTERRLLLEKLFGKQMFSLSTQDGLAMWDMVQDWKLEGLIAKLGSGRYYPGKRHPSWVKLKDVKRIHALVGGVVAGKGSRGAVGSLDLYLWNPATRELQGIGRVGSGIRDADAGIIIQRLADGLPVVVEVEYLEVAPTGLLRMPTFKGIRLNIKPDTCTTDTLKR